MKEACPDVTWIKLQFNVWEFPLYFTLNGFFQAMIRRDERMWRWLWCALFFHTFLHSSFMGLQNRIWSAASKLNFWTPKILILKGYFIILYWCEPIGVCCCFLLSGLFFCSVGKWGELSPVVSSAVIMTLSDALCYHHHIVPRQCSSSQLVSVLLGVFTFLFLLTLCQLQDDFIFLPCWKRDQLFLLS